MRTITTFVAMLAFAGIVAAGESPCVPTPEGYDSQSYPYLGGPLNSDQMSERGLTESTLKGPCTGLNWNAEHRCFVRYRFESGTKMLEDSVGVLRYKQDCGNPVFGVSCNRTTVPPPPCVTCPEPALQRAEMNCPTCNVSVTMVNSPPPFSPTSEKEEGNEKNQGRNLWWPTWVIAAILFLGLSGIIVALLLRRKRGGEAPNQSPSPTTAPPAPTTAQTTVAQAPTAPEPISGAQGAFNVNVRPSQLVIQKGGSMIWTGFPVPPPQEENPPGDTEEPADEPEESTDDGTPNDQDTG